VKKIFPGSLLGPSGSAGPLAWQGRLSAATHVGAIRSVFLVFRHNLLFSFRLHAQTALHGQSDTIDTAIVYRAVKYTTGLCWTLTDTTDLFCVSLEMR